MRSLLSLPLGAVVAAVLLLPSIAGARDTERAVVLAKGGGSATEVAEVLRKELATAGVDSSAAANAAEFLGREGGIERCDDACLDELARSLPDVKLFVVEATTGGGWTAARIEMRTGKTVVALASFLTPDGSRRDAAVTAARRVLEQPGTLRIRGVAPGMAVHVDGKITAGPVELAHGRHTVRVGTGAAAGELAAVDIRAGRPAEIDMSAFVPPRPVVPTVWWKRPWVIAGAAGLLVASGAFAATEGFGTLTPRTTTVILE